MEPGVVGVLHIVLLANLPHCGGNVGIPSRTHSGEQMVFHLKVESSGKVSSNMGTIRATGLNLRFEPANLFTRLAKMRRGITVGVLEVVRQRKGNGKGQTFRHTQDQNVKECSEDVVVLERTKDIHVDVHEPQSNGPLSARYDVIIKKIHSYASRSTLVQVEHLGIEHGRNPVSS